LWLGYYGYLVEVGKIKRSTTSRSAASDTLRRAI
jgi:hypothetical protein